MVGTENVQSGWRLLNSIEDVKGNEIQSLRTDSSLQGYVMSTWLYNIHMDMIQKKCKWGLQTMEVRFSDDDLVLCSRSENNLSDDWKFVKIRKKGGLKMNPEKNKQV